MEPDIYRGKDPRDIPTYRLSEVAHIVGVPTKTLSYWVNGKKGQTSPLILKSDPTSYYLSFNDVIEAYAIASLRRIHGVPLQKIRAGDHYLREHFNEKRPLINRDIETDGKYLYIRHPDGDTIINVSRWGQTALKYVEAYLKRVERDVDGRAKRLFPIVRRRNDLEPDEIIEEPKIVMIDPRVSFGKPSLYGSGIPTDVLWDFFRAGDSMLELANEYGRDIKEIEEAIRFESLAA
jgi:uncharacterized protein (DUF433 family)